MSLSIEIRDRRDTEVLHAATVETDDLVAFVEDRIEKLRAEEIRAEITVRRGKAWVQIITGPASFAVRASDQRGARPEFIAACDTVKEACGETLAELRRLRVQKDLGLSRPQRDVIRNAAEAARDGSFMHRAGNEVDRHCAPKQTLDAMQRKGLVEQVNGWTYKLTETGWDAAQRLGAVVGEPGYRVKATVRWCPSMLGPEQGQYCACFESRGRTIQIPLRVESENPDLLRDRAATVLKREGYDHISVTMGSMRADAARIRETLDKARTRIEPRREQIIKTLTDMQSQMHLMPRDSVEAELRRAEDRLDRIESWAASLAELDQSRDVSDYRREVANAVDNLRRRVDKVRRRNDSIGCEATRRARAVLGSRIDAVPETDHDYVRIHGDVLVALIDESLTEA